MNKYIIFTTYQFMSSGGTSPLGYSNAIHSNYIGKTLVDTISKVSISISFEGTEGFPFLGLSNTNGWQADTFNILVNIVPYDSITGNTGTTKPISSDWRIYDVTNQIVGGTLGNIKQIDLHSTTFNVSLDEYNTKPIYDMSYLSYPSNLPSDDSKLCFGDEKYFMGNVKTDIGATSYTTDLKIKLISTEFNTSSNPTWTNGTKPLISEVGLYDETGILVAIAKLSSPITKDDAIKAINFQIDF